MTFDRLSHKKTIHSLTNRVELLESLLVKHGIEIPLECAIESHQHDSGDNERANEEATGSYALSDCDQGGYQPELENAAQSTQSVQQFLGLSELGILQSHHTDLIDLFQSPAALWQSVYDFNQTNDKSQGIMKNPGHAILPDCSIVQTESNASTGYCTFCGESTIPNASANTYTGRSETRLVSGSTFPSVDRMHQNNSAMNGHMGGSGPLSCISSQNCSTEQNWQSDDDEIMDQLSARMGEFQIAEDGQLRYFGATSNLHILQNGLSSLSPALNRSVLRAKGEKILSRAGLEQKVNQDLERHLEDLYFRWEDPAIHVVDEDMYFLAKGDYYAGQDGSSFYSETLKNAM